MIKTTRHVKDIDRSLAMVVRTWHCMQGQINTLHSHPAPKCVPIIVVGNIPSYCCKQGLQAGSMSSLSLDVYFQTLPNLKQKVNRCGHNLNASLKLTNKNASTI